MEELLGRIERHDDNGLCTIVPLNHKYKKLYYSKECCNPGDLVLVKVESVNNNHENVDKSLLQKVTDFTNLNVVCEDNIKVLNGPIIDELIKFFLANGTDENETAFKCLKEKITKDCEEVIFSQNYNKNDIRLKRFRSLYKYLKETYREARFDFSLRALTSWSGNIQKEMWFWDHATYYAQRNALFNGNYENRQELYDEQFRHFVDPNARYDPSRDDIIKASEKVSNAAFFRSDIYNSRVLPLDAKYKRFEKLILMKNKNSEEYRRYRHYIFAYENMLIYFIYKTSIDVIHLISEDLNKVIARRNFRKLKLVMDVIENKSYEVFRSDLINLLNEFEDFKKINDMSKFLEPLFFKCDDYVSATERGGDKLFCEAQIYKNVIYCEMRGYGADSCFEDKIKYHGGKKLYDLCKMLNYHIKYSGKDLGPEQIVTRAAGYFNQLNRAKEHLYCRNCNGKLMNFKFEYNKNGAIYIKTVAECEDCGEIVYLNRCWHCGSIIDSRDSKFQDNGYYICINCGAGDKRKLHRPTGTCPKCGKSGIPSMYIDYSGNEEDIEAREGIFKCKYCGHEIKRHRTDNDTSSPSSYIAKTQNDEEDGEIPF